MFYYASALASIPALTLRESFIGNRDRKIQSKQ